MFLDRDTSGGDGLNISHINTSIHRIQVFDTMQVVSNTGNRERRKIIQSWNTEELVNIHNLLVTEIIKNGTISVSQKNILQSMEQEGIHTEGKFYGKIQEDEGTQKVPHLEGISRYNPLQGNTDIIKGETRLRMWLIL